LIVRKLVELSANDLETLRAMPKPMSQQNREDESQLPGADPLVAELKSLAATEYPLCPEARLLLEMAVDAQLGKPIDMNRLNP
jgi:hypothetical protein